MWHLVSMVVQLLAWGFAIWLFRRSLKHEYRRGVINGHAATRWPASREWREARQLLDEIEMEHLLNSTAERQPLEDQL